MTNQWQNHVLGEWVDAPSEDAARGALADGTASGIRCLAAAPSPGDVGELVAKLREHALFYKERPAIDQDKRVPQMAEISERETAAETAILNEAADAIERLTSDCERLRTVVTETVIALRDLGATGAADLLASQIEPALSQDAKETKP